jgi:hypothetical protein
MKKKMLITLITVAIVIVALIASILVLVFKPDRIIKFKTTTIFHFRETVPENTIVGILISDGVKPKYFEKAATFAVGFKKPLFCYFDFNPTYKGRPIPVDRSQSERDRIAFFYLFQEKNDFAYDKSLTFVREQKEGHYIGYIIPICIRDGKVYGNMFNSSELYNTLMDVFKKNDVSVLQNSIKKP